MRPGAERSFERLRSGRAVLEADASFAKFGLATYLFRVMLEHGSPAPAKRIDLQVDGVFGEEEAARLVGVLARVAPWQRVRVHFHHVSQFHDHVVAMLARELTASYGRNIELVGLSRHQLRVLRYMTAHED